MNYKWFDNLVDAVRIYLPQVDEDRLKEAYKFSEKVYKKLKDDHPESDFILRPKNVVDALIPFKPDEDTVVSAFLYDAIDSGVIDKADLDERYGEEVMSFLDGLQILKSIRVVNYKSADKVDLLRKLFLVMAKDIRVLVVLLAVRVVQMRLLEKLPEDCSVAFAGEVFEIFVPIAARLGVYRYKTVLEDYCFRYLQAEDYKNISAQLDKMGRKKQGYIDSVCRELKEFYESHGFSGVKVTGRLKGVYSIYNKMKKKGLTDVDGVYDLFAVRVILPSVHEFNMEEDVSKLYEALGTLHSRWKPIASRFKDFVAVPKPNGYRSLHTTVLGLSNGDFMHPVEVQLRSDAMHEEAEYGVASHWLYKDTRGKGFAMLKAHVDWLKSLAALHADIKGDEKALDSIKLDIFGDRIYVLTPRGDVKELPTGATTLDFAYAVHTDIGHRCILAKVNGKPVSFDTELENGDTIEIVTRKDGVPKLEWLSIVKTSQAKVKIKNWFAAQDRQKNVKRGRDQLNTQLARFGKPLLAPSLNILKGFGGGKLNSTEREKILEEIGKGTQSASNVIRKLFEYYDLLEDKKYEIMREKKDKKVEARAKAKAKDLDDSVILGGVTGMKSNFAKCCNPSSGDDIVGYVSSLKDSATVHKRECPILAGLNPERVVSAHFKGADGRKRGQLYRVRVRIEADERIGLLGDVGSTVAANGVNIVSYGPLDSGKAGIAWVLLELDVGDLEQFEKALNSIERVSGVRSVIKVT